MFIYKIPRTNYKLYKRPLHHAMYTPRVCCKMYRHTNRQPACKHYSTVLKCAILSSLLNHLLVNNWQYISTTQSYLKAIIIITIQLHLNSWIPQNLNMYSTWNFNINTDLGSPTKNNYTNNIHVWFHGKVLISPKYRIVFSVDLTDHKTTSINSTTP